MNGIGRWALLAFAVTLGGVFPWGNGSGGAGGMVGLQAYLTTVNVDPPSVPNDECVDVLVPVSGVTDDDYVAAQALCELPPSVFVDGAWGAGENTVSVRICNLSTFATEDPLPCDFQFFRVRRQ